MSETGPTQGGIDEARALQPGVQVFRSVHRTHSQPDEMVFVGLRQQMQDEFGAGWCLAITTQVGNCYVICDQGRDIFPPPEILMSMISTTVLVNREAHNNGVWFTVWHDNRICAGWRDWDGDLAFLIQFDEPWSRIANWSYHEFAERMYAGWMQWRDEMRDFELGPTETYRKALGEQSHGRTRH